MKQSYCPRCRRFAESIVSEDKKEFLCKRCGRVHKHLDIPKLLIGNIA